MSKIGEDSKESFEAEPSATQMPWDRYRLRAQVEELSAEGLAPGAAPYLPPTIGVAGKEESPPLIDGADDGGDATSRDTDDTDRVGSRFRAALRTPRLPKSLRILRGGELALVTISVLGLLLAAVFLVNSSDPRSVGIYSLIALIPLTGVVLLLLWADRFAPVRRRALVIAALWGGGAATAVAGLVNTAFFTDFTAIFGDVSRAESLTAVVVAPIGEELLKGAGVVMVLLFTRRYLVHPINGLVVGAITGAGFAYVENIQYFLQAEAQGTAVLGMTIVARAVMSPFIHPMATSFIGYFVALALIRNPRAWGWVWRICLGFVVAVAVHALWNGLALLGPVWIFLYLFLELPLFIVWLVWVLRAAGKQARRVRNGLEPYLAAGWIGVDEVQMVCDRRARRFARRWARKVGRDARRAVSRYLGAAGRLGLDQLNMENIGPEPKRVALARESLATMISSREEYLRIGAIHQATTASLRRRGTVR